MAVDINEKIFINEFQKGSSENANLGFGTMLGIENYSVKGTARLTKVTKKISGSTVTDLPVFITAKDNDTYFIQGDTGKVYRYVLSTDTLTDISPVGDVGAGNGKGLISFDGVLYEFISTKIKYLKTPYNGGAAWVDWSPTIIPGNGTTLNTSIHTPFIFPSAFGFYFANGNSIGLIQEKVSGTAIDPATPATYNCWYQIFSLPPLYTINCLSFLPPSNLVMGTGSATDQTIADIISWDTISLNKFSPPLRLFSQAPQNENGVKQLINRNNILYAVTGGNSSIFATNGSTFNLIADLSLYSNIRAVGGAQAQVPVFMNPKVGAIDVFGNKLLTGVSTPSSIAYYPANKGLYPVGVWSVAFGDSGNSLQCEYVISTNTTVALAQYSIGALKCVGTNQTLIGWRDGNTYGVDLVSTTDYQNVIGNTAIESEMLEIGTPLSPETIQTFQMNCPRELVAGQTVSFYWRTGFEKDYTLLESFTSANNTDNGYKNINNEIGATRFLQLKLSMASATDQKTTPEIRNIIVSK